MWQKLIGRSLTPIQRIGAGHVFNKLGITVSAIVEAKRLKIAHAHMDSSNHENVGLIVPMVVAVPTIEIPSSLNGTATAMAGLTIGIAFYLSAAIVDLVRKVTSWLPNDINYGRLDNVYWLVLVIGVLNFFYFLLCAKLYKYQNFG
ncbi:LOW QUALITY PROTEIN: hypothetical protein RJ641_008569 [Dillenia turbinata]|uniref:Uncharacterized protein n=1 Tax=Dillenia turbinata TaxID=194707 RepID=A0AAN8Z932_9MAGN